MTDLLSDDLLIPTLSLARKTTRWLASLIDYIFYTAILWAIPLYFGEKYTSQEGRVSYHAEGIPALCIWAAWWVLLPIVEGITGQTLGKAVFKIKTVKENGSKATIGNCIVRHLFDMVDFAPFLGIVGLLVAGNNEKKQRVGDLVAKTVVVNTQNKSAHF